jgi:hypothetical protein
VTDLADLRAKAEAATGNFRITSSAGSHPDEWREFAEAWDECTLTDEIWDRWQEIVSHQHRSSLCHPRRTCARRTGRGRGESGYLRPHLGDIMTLTKKANPFAAVPTGMCGSAKVCAECPSHFLCAMKAGDEQKIIRSRPDSVFLDCDGDHGERPDEHHEGCWVYINSLPPMEPKP